MLVFAWIGAVPGFVYGFTTGVYLSLYVALVAYSLMLDGSVLRSMGAEAERWTSQELRKLGWQVIDAVEFDDFDIDHVLVGPELVVAVETKWSSKSVTIGTGGVSGLWVDAEAQAARSAKRLQRFLASRGIDHPVIPLLVLWGPGMPPIDGGYKRIGDVRVVVGKQADEWRDRLRTLPRWSRSTHGVPEVIEHYISEFDRGQRPSRLADLRRVLASS